MKVVGIAVVRTGSDLEDPIPLTVASDLSSFGFFQRQVSPRINDESSSQHQPLRCTGVENVVGLNVKNVPRLVDCYFY